MTYDKPLTKRVIITLDCEIETEKSIPTFNEIMDTVKRSTNGQPFGRASDEPNYPRLKVISVSCLEK